jgi:hypothetical protein
MRVLTGPLIALCVCLLSPLARAQERTFSNPLIESFGGPIAVSDVEVRYPADAFSGSLDRPSARYVAQNFSNEARQAFAAFAAPRGDAPDAMGERLSEHLAESDLRSRFASSDPGARALRVAIEVTEVRFRGMLAAALAPSFPSTDMAFTLYDSETNAVFASGRIRRCASWAQHIESARAKHGLQFNWSGTDTNFRMMAGMTNALADCVQQLLTSPNFPTDRATIGTAHTGAPFFLSVPITINEPIYEIQLGQTPADQAP